MYLLTLTYVPSYLNVSLQVCFRWKKCAQNMIKAPLNIWTWLQFNQIRIAAPIFFIATNFGLTKKLETLNQPKIDKLHFWVSSQMWNTKKTWGMIFHTWMCQYGLILTSFAEKPILEKKLGQSTIISQLAISETNGSLQRKNKREMRIFISLSVSQQKDRSRLNYWQGLTFFLNVHQS